MNRAVGGVWLALAALAPAQERAPGLFKVDRTRDPVVVSADINGVTCDRALLELGVAMDWRVDFETKALEGALGITTVDLAFDGQPARVVAHLLAAAGGADVVFDDRAEEGAVRTRVHVVSPADATIESGRRRLRQWAIQWYHSFLQRDAVYDPLVVESGMRVRMQLAQMKLEQGDLGGAAQAFQELYDRDQTHPDAPLAMLRVAECSFELRKLDEAERWARRVTELHPSRPEMAAAAVLLGRIMLQGERYDEAVRELRSYLLPLADTPEILDIYLLLAEAHAQRGRPDETLRTVQIIEGKSYREFTPKQLADFLYLRGLGAEGSDQPKLGMESLELFLGMVDNDSRRGRAQVMLARAYAKQDRFLEARASALAAMQHRSELDKEWLREAGIVHAKTAIDLGDRDKAFADLEWEVRTPGADPKLILFLVDEFYKVGRYQKAVVTAELLASEDTPEGQIARVRKLRALLGQAKQNRQHLAAFPKQALAIAAEVTEEPLQREVAEILGSAYELLGDVERAADAYRGVLR
jgi:tetratricopeptide (TPR) repeat protein